MAGYKYSQRKMRRNGLSEDAAGLPGESPPPLANGDIYSCLGAHIRDLESLSDQARPNRATTWDGNGSAHMHHLMKALQSSRLRSVWLVNHRMPLRWGNTAHD